MTSHNGSLAGGVGVGVGSAGTGRSEGTVTFTSAMLTYFDSFVTKEDAFAKGSCSGAACDGQPDRDGVVPSTGKTYRDLGRDAKAAFGSAVRPRPRMIG